MMMIIDQWTMVSWWAGSLRPLTFLPASYPRLPDATVSMRSRLAVPPATAHSASVRSARATGGDQSTTLIHFRYTPSHDGERLWRGIPRPTSSPFSSGGTR